MFPRFSVVVPTYERPDALRECLIALAAQEYDRELYETIVVDNAALGHVRPVVEAVDLNGMTLVLESDSRGGAATARNLGARKATGEVLLFVDDDIIVGPDHLQRHARRLEVVGKEGLVNGAWEFAPAVRAQLEATPFGRFRLELEDSFMSNAKRGSDTDEPIEMEMLGTWDLSLSRDLFWELGGFDEEFPVAGAEDQDFSVRASERGCTLWLDPSIVCLHNDNRLDLAAYCAREERSASTMPFLVRNHPERFGDLAYVRENTPVRRSDPVRLVVKKLAKTVLGTETGTRALESCTRWAERAGAPDRVLRRLYTLLLGLHLFRGFRSTWCV